MVVEDTTLYAAHCGNHNTYSGDNGRVLRRIFSFCRDLAHMKVLYVAAPEYNELIRFCTRRDGLGNLAVFCTKGANCRKRNKGEASKRLAFVRYNCAVRLHTKACRSCLLQ